jgi:SAM-dependent methyltransferase
VIERIVQPKTPARILEIGCGTGHNLTMLGRFGDLHACELDDRARDIASARLGRPVVEAKLPQLSGFAPRTYDLIALLDVLEHVSDDEDSLKSIRRLLKPDGMLLLTVPANPWMWSAHDVAHHHFRRYSKRQLSQLFDRAGLTPVVHSHFNSLLFPLIALARLVGKLRGRESTDDVLPSPFVNAALQFVFGMEAKLIGRVPMPFGVSLIAVLRPRADA